MSHNSPMAKVQDVLEAIEKIAPSRFAFSDDKIGLQLGDAGADVRQALVSLDWSEALVEHAARIGATLLVVHHPLIWDPMTRVLESELRGRMMLRLARMKVSYIACHTNWDAASGGISDTMAHLLGLSDVAPFGEGSEVSYLKLVTFCPQESLQAIIDALAAVGAGVIGQYERCAFSSSGTGTFRGLEGSNPTVGEAGKIETAPEIRLEMRLLASLRPQAEAALRSLHPYEEPAFDFFTLNPTVEMPLGRIGTLPKPMSFAELRLHADRTFETRSLAWGNPTASVRRLAVIGGAGDDFWQAAKAAGADTFLTGEVRQHVALEGSQSGLGMVASGHFATEHPGCKSLCERLKSALPRIQWEVFTPEPGSGGRPI